MKICPKCKSDKLEIIEYLKPTHGDFYWCRNCKLKWTDFAVIMAGKYLK